MSTENYHKKIHSLMTAIIGLINVLARSQPRYNTMFQSEKPLVEAGKAPELMDAPSGDFDRIFLKSIRIRFEPFSEP